MANKAKGEVELSLDDGSTRTLKFATNELCALEQHLGLKNISELNDVLQPENLKFATVRAFLWAALQKHHPDTTLDAAGDLIDSLGMTEAINLVVLTMNAGMPAAKPDAQKKTD